MSNTPQKMHDDEIEINETMVRHLIRTQFPHWDGLTLTSIESGGTDNMIFRLGDTMAIRLPRVQGATAQIEKEAAWLNYLAPLLPLEIPHVIAIGVSDPIYPFSWAIHEWIEGEPAILNRLEEHQQATRDLARFITTMQQINTAVTDDTLLHSSRSVPLSTRDHTTRACIDQLDGIINTKLALEIWEYTLRTSPWNENIVWMHGDLQAGNLLAHHGKLVAVIDFGLMSLGDPACDLQVAWNLLTPDLRSIFKDAIGADEATWIRGRGWALSIALIALPYYINSNPWLANISRYTIQQIFEDYMHVGSC